MHAKPLFANLNLFFGKSFAGVKGELFQKLPLARPWGVAPNPAKGTFREKFRWNPQKLSENKNMGLRTEVLYVQSLCLQT